MQLTDLISPPVFISVALPVSLYLWAKRDQKSKDEIKNNSDIRVAELKSQDTFRENIMEQVQSLQAENSKQRETIDKITAELWKYQRECLDLRHASDELIALKKENEIDRLNKRTRE